jgi:hypothetical protein
LEKKMTDQEAKYTLDERIAYATEMLAAANAAMARADARADSAREMGGGIPGLGGSGSQRAAGQVRSAWSSADKAWREASERIEHWTYKLARLKVRQAEEQRVRLTRDDIKGATHVRTQHGWHKVARVNAKSVSVETGYPWVDRYEFDKIREVRTLTNA